MLASIIQQIFMKNEKVLFKSHARLCKPQQKRNAHISTHTPVRKAVIWKKKKEFLISFLKTFLSLQWEDCLIFRIILCLSVGISFIIFSIIP